MNNSKPQKSRFKRSLQTPPQAISKAPPCSSKPLIKYPENSQKSPLCHPFEPIIFSHSKILILGSFPSVASRQESFYYAHKQNRFWKILEGLFDSPLYNQPKEYKIAFLKSHHIALFDITQECYIQNSSDSTLKILKPNPIHSLIQNTQIQAIFTNGQKASKLYCQFFYHQDSPHFIPLPHIPLPSSSPANAKCTLPLLLREAIHNPNPPIKPILSHKSKKSLQAPFLLLQFPKIYKKAIFGIYHHRASHLPFVALYATLFVPTCQSLRTFFLPFTHQKAKDSSPSRSCILSFFKCKRF